jgi:hypothetical protein
VFSFLAYVLGPLNKHTGDLERDLFWSLNVLQENTGAADGFPADVNSSVSEGDFSLLRDSSLPRAEGNRQDPVEVRSPSDAVQRNC